LIAIIDDHEIDARLATGLNRVDWARGAVLSISEVLRQEVSSVTVSRVTAGIEAAIVHFQGGRANLCPLRARNQRFAMISATS